MAPVLFEGPLSEVSLRLGHNFMHERSPVVQFHWKQRHHQPLRIGTIGVQLLGLSKQPEGIQPITGFHSLTRQPKAQLLMLLYSIRSERMLIEELRYNLLFRWFVGLAMNEEVWHATVFTKNRDRLLAGEVAREFFASVVRQARRQGLMSSEHFSVDGTMLEAWASQKSFRPMQAIRERTIRAKWGGTRRSTSAGCGGAMRRTNR